jgi:hypothetical protein
MQWEAELFRNYKPCKPSVQATLDKFEALQESNQKQSKPFYSFDMIHYQAEMISV